MPEKWVKDRKSKNGYTYKKVMKKKKEYWYRERYNPIIITFKPNLVKRGVYNNDS